MTIVSLDLMLRAGRFVGSPHGKSRLGEFARICRRRRSCDSFRNRPYGRPILLCPKGNEGMSEVYQCFKYRAVFLAQCKRVMPDVVATAILVVEALPPGDIKVLAALHKVQIKMV